MARMISPAGEMNVTITDIKTNKEEVIICGQIGVWDSEIFVKPDEMNQIIRLMLKPRFLLFLVSLPFKSIKSRKKVAE